MISVKVIPSRNSPLTVEIIWCTCGNEYMPYNSSTLTLPSLQILERSFLTRSTTITFSERSFSLLCNSSLLIASFFRSGKNREEVPLIGCDKILLPCFLRYLSGLAHTRKISLNLYNAENGLGETALSFL